MVAVTLRRVPARIPPTFSRLKNDTMRILPATFVAMLALGCSGIAAAEEPLFSLVISYDSPDNVTNVSAWLDRPAGKHGSSKAATAICHRRRPLRFWGTNLVFNACVPMHEQAERVAVRLARLGINCVRISQRRYVFHLGP